jgi:hypothetical protein
MTPSSGARQDEHLRTKLEGVKDATAMLRTLEAELQTDARTNPNVTKQVQFYMRRFKQMVKA